MALRFSTKGRYGIRALCRLAGSDGEGPVTIQTIANEENIPIRYLEQIMVKLSRQGILKSARGPGGGYRFDVRPDQVSLGRVLEILEGDISVVWCVDENRETGCARKDTCTAHLLWSTLNHAIRSILNNMTFQDLLDGNLDEIDTGSLLNRGKS